MTELLSFIILLLTIVATLATLLSALLHSRNPKLFHDLSYSRLHSGRTRFDAKKKTPLLICDLTMFAVGWLLAALSVLFCSPLMILHAILLLFSKTTPIIRTRKIIGKNRKPIQLFRFNTKLIESQSTGIMPRIIRAFDRAAISELPILFNLLRCDITLFGLARIQYENLATIAEHNEDLLQQYDWYRPGIVNLTILNKNYLTACEDTKEYYKKISFLNRIFLRGRSFEMILNMLKAAVLLSFRPLDED